MTILITTRNKDGTSIYKHPLESKLLGAIGHAQMEKEIQKTVEQVNRDKIWIREKNARTSRVRWNGTRKIYRVCS